jgi:hypothetical protein
MSIESGLTRWMSAAVLTRLSAVSKAEFPFPTMSTRWFTKSAGSTDTSSYPSASSIPGMAGMYGFGTPVAATRRSHEKRSPAAVSTTQRPPSRETRVARAS